MAADERIGAWRPDSGSFRHEFDFDPLHYGVGGEQQRLFKQRMREQLSRYGFYFSDEVAVYWVLHVDEQQRWESDRGADVDNFAKLLNDGMCGPDGILIDDVQVQSLHVSWMSTARTAHFDLRIDARPEEWISRPAQLYQLGDGLWYPFTDAYGPVPAQVLWFLDEHVSQRKRVRHEMRKLGSTADEAYRYSGMTGPVARGFHSTRAAASQFSRVPRREWQLRYPRPTDMADLRDPTALAKAWTHLARSRRANGDEQSRS